MARTARIVVPGYPHHVTQRGNRRQETFFREEDYLEYIRLMSEWCKRHGGEIWGYCLMPKHVHLTAVPQKAESLARAIGEAHRRYTRYINFREGWRGYLWQGRFGSYAMDQEHLISAARYIELNPVRAGLVKHPGDYKWSSARAHLAGKDDGLAKAAPLLEIIRTWDTLLASGRPDEEQNNIKRHTRTGRPLGSDRFLEAMENVLGRRVRPHKPGPKPKRQALCPRN